MRLYKLAIPLLMISPLSFGEVGHFNVEKCRSVLTVLFDRFDEKSFMSSVNTEIQDRCDSLNIKKIDYINYTNEKTIFRNKESACVFATIWYEK